MTETGAGALRGFYEDTYSHTGEEARRYEAWRHLSARIKADHVLALLGAARRNAPALTVLDVGCGDASVLAELVQRRPGWTPAGVELADQATRIARDRLPGADLRTYDGETLPWPDASFALGLLSHVIEHVPDPGALLRETARVCALVFVEVPLEANVSARRRAARDASEKVGHLHRFSSRHMHELFARSGLRLLAESRDPLPRSVHRYFTPDGPRARIADAKWLVRAALARVSQDTAERLFTMHHAALCEAGRSTGSRVLHR